MNLMKRVSRYLLLTLLVFFIFTPLNILAETANKDELNYVALGDSLAAGILNDLTQGIGYPAHIQAGIEEETPYSVNLDNRGVGGYTTIDVVEQLANNHNDIREELTEADIITLDIGANDLLGKIDFDAIDPFDPEGFNELLIEAEREALPIVEENFDLILSDLRELNPEASIYVMGYYNGLYFLPDYVQDTVRTIMGNLNQTIATSAENYHAFYVSTLETFEGKYDLYLPDPDIHPTEEGYEAIAVAFLEQIIPNLEPIDDIEAPVITLNGDAEIELNVGESYKELGATAEDNVDGDLTDEIEITGEVNTDIPGKYTITYTVSDAAGNVATKTRVVYVVEHEESKDPGEVLKAALTALNNAATIEAMQTALTNEDLGLHLEDYDKLSADQQVKVASIVLTNRPDEGYSSVEAIQETLNNAIADITKSDEKVDKGGELPKTATNNPLMILISSLMTVTGGALIFIQRKVLN